MESPKNKNKNRKWPFQKTKHLHLSGHYIFLKCLRFTKEKFHLVTHPPTTLGKLVQQRAYLENLPGYCEVPISIGQQKTFSGRLKTYVSFLS